jgi:hypothetical protein
MKRDHSGEHASETGIESSNAVQGKMRPRLVLEREVVRTLTATELGLVAGGGGETGVGGGCTRTIP